PPLRPALRTTKSTASGTNRSLPAVINSLRILGQLVHGPAPRVRAPAYPPHASLGGAGKVHRVALDHVDRQRRGDTNLRDYLKITETRHEEAVRSGLGKGVRAFERFGQQRSVVRVLARNEALEEQISPRVHP